MISEGLGIEQRMLPGLRPVVVGLRAAFLRAPLHLRAQSEDGPAGRLTRRRVAISIETMPLLPPRPARWVTLALAVIVGLDAVGVAIGCLLRRRRGRAARAGPTARIEASR